MSRVMPLLPESRRMALDGRSVATGLWILHGARGAEVLLSENAHGILPNAIAAARKMLADDERESADCQSSPECARVDLYQHSVGGMGGWAETYVGKVTRRRGYVRA